MEVIGIISAHYLPHLGGVERYTYNLAKRLLKEEKKVIIITSAFKNLPWKEEMEGIKIYRLPSFSFMSGRMPVLNLNRECKTKIKEIEKEKIDRIIINTHLYTLSCWGSYWAKKNKIKAILIEHGTKHMDFNRRWINKLSEVYEHVLMTFIKRYISDFYGVSISCNKWLKHFGIKGKGVLYNAIRIEDFKNKTPCYREKLEIEQEKIVISFVGRLIEEKGIRKVCEAFEKLDQTKVCLIIAGDGELFTELKNKYKDILWLGAIEHEEVIQLLHITDIYILPTDYPEGFPTSVLEAAMCACCIVTTNAGGSKELIINSSYGVIMQDNSVEELKEKLEWLLSQGEIRGQMGRNVQNRVKKHFTWDLTVKKVIEELESL